MKFSTLLFLLLLSCVLFAQTYTEPLVSPNEDVYAPFGNEPSPAHFVPVFIEPGACISDEDRALTRKRIEENRKKILENNPEAFDKRGAVEFIKPIKARDDFDDYGYYTLNFLVDHNLTTNNNLLDYNCGHRTYDWSTGNHRGSDYILWPYPWKNMELGTMEIVAAADGIIVDRRDGFFDKRCVIDGNPNWNGIVLEHSDGSQTWYLHFKNGSITEKLIGQTVSAGEYLGLAGSSGASNWPHLHFEVWDGDENLIDPYAGPCNNMNSESWWADQADYHVRTINRISTHYTIEHDANCPEIENTYEELNFNHGDLFVMKLFYRDIQEGDITSIQIFRPNNTTLYSWNWTQNWGQDYATAYAHWTIDVTTAWPEGVYTLRATFGGQVYETIFGVGTTLSSSRVQPKQFTLYPNPANNAITIDSPYPIEQISIKDATGRVVKTFKPNTTSQHLDFHRYPAGTYYISVLANGVVSSGSFIKAE